LILENEPLLGRKMHSHYKMQQIAYILFVSGVLTLGTASASAEGRTSSQVVSGNGLTRQQFEALPDTALIDFNGRRTTKARIRAKEAQSRDAAERVQALAQQSRAEFKQRLTRYEQERKTQLGVARTKAMEEFARLSQAQARQVKAIEVEAAQLQERSRRASPAEKVQIEQRADQLLQQLYRLEDR